MIIVGFLLYKLLFPNTGTPIYGNRLDGINDVNYTKDSLNVIAEKIKEEKVVNADYLVCDEAAVKYIEEVLK